MPEKSLPIYQIRDFKESSGHRPNFYLNAFETHLREHAFIQKPHKHDFYILILITSGSGTHTIDFQQFEVKPGTVYFLSPGQVHSWQLSADTKGFVLFFNREFYLTGHPDNNLVNFPFFNSTLNKPVLIVPHKEFQDAVFLVHGMEAEIKNNGWKKEEVLRNLLDILLIKLARTYQEVYKNTIIAKDGKTGLQNLEVFIDQHFKEHLPVSFYAGKMNLTLKQLNDLCKNTIAKTTTELLQDRILLEARRLLTHSNLTITQIAAELGYFDNSYFSRFFKKHSGQTPEQFRQSITENS